ARSQRVRRRAARGGERPQARAARGAAGVPHAPGLAVERVAQPGGSHAQGPGSEPHLSLAARYGAARREARGVPTHVSARPLRVLHGTYEIAGRAMMLARALRVHGSDSRAFSYRVDWDGRVSDDVVDLDRAGGPVGKGLAMLRAFARHGLSYDVVHLHFGTSFLPRQWDVPWIKR